MGLGGRIGYFTGDPLRLLEDAQVLKPNFFPSVPRVLNKIYQSAMAAGSAPGLKGAIFTKAVTTKLNQLRTTGVTSHALWDRLVFRKVRLLVAGGDNDCLKSPTDSGCAWRQSANFVQWFRAHLC